MEDGGSVVVVRAWHAYVGGARGSGIVSGAADVLGMSVVRGMRGVGGMCEMCMCLARGGVGGVCIHLVVIGLYVRLSRYPRWVRCLQCLRCLR